MNNVTLQEIRSAAFAGQKYGEQSYCENYYTDGVYEDGPVKYKDPRINVVTMTLRNMMAVGYDEPLALPGDMATIGNAIVAALDYFKENHEQ